MFEGILIIYVMIHVGYIYYANKKNFKGEALFLEKVGKPLGLIMGNDNVIKMIPSSSVVKIKELYGSTDIEKGLLQYQYSRIGLIYVIVFLGGLFALVIGRDYSPAVEQAFVIERPLYGDASDSLKLSYEIEGEGAIQGYVDVWLEEQLPVVAVAEQLLDSKKAVLYDLVIGDQLDPQKISDDLTFLPYPFEQSIEVVYRSLTPKYLRDNGQLRTNLMDYDESYPIEVEVMLAYGTVEKRFVYEFVAIKKLPSIGEEHNLIKERIMVEEKEVVLPSETEVGRNRIHWRTVEEGVSGSQVFFVSCLFGLLLYLFKAYELTQSVQKRHEEILYDFPDVVNKLTILMNAGMTFNRAWFKIVEDYQKKDNGKRTLFEEMVKVSVDLQTGLSEVQAIEAFGKRCHCIEVIRLSSMLVQNLRHGSQSLTSALKELRVEVWAIRTSNARKLGEKASTKLLIPMAISLLTVLLVVIAPTFMKMQL